MRCLRSLAAVLPACTIFLVSPITGALAQFGLGQGGIGQLGNALGKKPADSPQQVHATPSASATHGGKLPAIGGADSLHALRTIDKPMPDVSEELAKIAAAQKQLVSSDASMSTEHLLEYFQAIIDTTYSPELKEWFRSFKNAAGSQNPVLWSCHDVVQASQASKELAYIELQGVHQNFERTVKGLQESGDANANMYWAPQMIHKLTILMSGVINFNSALFHLRQECVPRIVKEQFMLLLFNWRELYSDGISQIQYWSFHYNAFAFLLDHPARPVEANIAYLGSFLGQVVSLIETDLAQSTEVFRYFAEGKAISEVQLKHIVVEELQLFGDNIDGEGKFTPFEVLYRSMFNRWFLDEGLCRGFLRWVVDHYQSGSTMVDLGGGGGHYSEYFNKTGLVSSVAYDAPVNLLVSGLCFRFEAASRPFRWGERGEVAGPVHRCVLVFPDSLSFCLYSAPSS